MTPAIVPLPLDGPLFEQAIAVYGAAFAQPPYSDPDRGTEIRDRMRDTHCAREGFRALAAIGGARVVAMAYGYHGAPGQWWHDAVAAALDPAPTARWLADSYELVEVAVDPACQGQGVGQAIIEKLLEGRPEATCVLSTRIDSRAHRLYRRLGFEVIREMPFVSRGPLFYEMGKPLNAEARP